MLDVISVYKYNFIDVEATTFTREKKSIYKYLVFDLKSTFGMCRTTEIIG